jgi:hypothetical protein
VQNNWQIAFKILYEMNTFMEISTYYDKLSSMHMNINALEFFNSLINEVDLPQEYIQVFIKSCIKQCNESTESQINKNRMIRLFSVFLS